MTFSKTLNTFVYKLFIFSMPKIINPDSISIESLTSKLNGLESQYTILSKNHSILQDSILSLNQTIIRADLKTNFFTDQLAFQLFVFSCILGILALFSWGLILRPMQNRITRLTTETIPNLEKDLKTETDQQRTNMDNNFATLKTLAYKGYIGTLRQAAASAAILKDVSLSFQTLILYLAMDVKYQGDTVDKHAVLKHLNSAKDLIYSSQFSINHITPDDNVLVDLEGYINFLTKHSDQDIAMISFKILEKFLELKPNRTQD